MGTRITRGQRIGTLGKTGGSGNFSHLHLGRGGNCYVNLYPWLVTAYQAEHPKAVFAVARPHHAVRTGVDYRSYAELTHRFQTAGIHIVTAQCQAAGKPIMQKLRVVVQSARPARIP